MKTIGFTGSRRGVTPEQKARLISMLTDQRDFTIAVHGMAIGADAFFHEAVRLFPKVKIIGYPGDIPKYRADVVCDVTFPKRNPMDRNRLIVDTSDLMIVGLPLTIIWPDGDTSDYN